MVWSRWIEDRIYSLYYRYDSHGNDKQMKDLKSLCMHEINTHPELKDALTDDRAVDYFILQVALENVRK